MRRTFKSTCPECAGKGVVPKGHRGRKRNSKPCPVCEGKGEVDATEEVKP